MCKTSTPKINQFIANLIYQPPQLEYSILPEISQKYQKIII